MKLHRKPRHAHLGAADIGAAVLRTCLAILPSAHCPLRAGWIRLLAAWLSRWFLSVDHGLFSGYNRRHWCGMRSDAAIDPLLPTRSVDQR
jgi:hypothetical protein